MRGAATRARISVVDPVAEKPRVEAKTIEWMTRKGETRGPGDGPDLIRGDSDRGDIPESDTQSGELVCGASAARPVQRMNIVESFFFRETERGEEAETEGRTEKKPLEAMNDIIEFHAAPIPIILEPNGKY